MKKYIVFLRAINISGRNIMKMAELKKLFEEIGFKTVKTYIQSGNIVFESSINDESKIKKQIESEIAKHFGFTVDVFVYEQNKLQEIINKNPYIEENSESKIKTVYFTFLLNEPDKDKLDKLKDENFENDKITVGESALYLNIKNGYSETKLNNTYIEKQLKVSATTRNLNTVEKICNL